jgi:hypothetical protein
MSSAVGNGANAEVVSMIARRSTPWPWSTRLHCAAVRLFAGMRSTFWTLVTEWCF